MVEAFAAVAQFGNQSGGHSLLWHAGAERAPFDRILMFTDRPPELDAREFGCIYAGYASTDGYIVQLTRADESAHRPGMVTTIAALIPVTLLGEISLVRVFDELEGRNEPAPVALADLGPAREAVEAPGSGALADALTTSGKALWTGDGFEAGLERVWSSLSLTDRSRLVFGTAVHPDGVSVPVSTTALVVLRTAERYASRWSWPSVAAATPGPETRAGRALLDPDDPVRTLGLELVGAAPSVEQWQYLTAVQERLSRLDELDHEATRALAQLVCLVAPNAEQGDEIKDRVAKRLHELTAGARFDDIRGLRGIDWPKLGASQTLDPLLGDWASAVWRDPRRASELATAVAQFASNDDEFLGRLEEQLRAAATSTQDLLAEQARATLRETDGMGVLRWVAAVFGHRELDRALGPLVEGQPPAWLAELARSERLPLTHAASVATTDPVAAWRAQLDLPRSAAASERLVDRVGVAGTVSAALALGDESLINRAAEFAAANPQLIPQDAPTMRAGRALWAAAVRAGADPWVVVDPVEARDLLLGDLLDGTPVDHELLRALAESRAADLSEQPRRAELWDRLPKDIAESFLAATAQAVAADLAAGGAVPEPELQRALLTPGILGQLARRDVRAALAVLDRLTAAGADNALVVLRAGRFDRDTAKAFGTLIVKRAWKQVAHALVDAEGRRPDLRAAADRAQALLGLRDRLKRAVGLGESVRAIATSNELAAALLEAATELYPRGPGERSLWERAGGNDGDLPHEKTGRESWRAAIAAANRGSDGAPTRADLLQRMVEDHPRNEELAALAEALRG